MALRVIKSISVTDAILTATNIPETDYGAWSSGTTYALGDRCILTSTHKIYESLQAGNTNKAPLSEQLWWVEVSPTNRWKAFDLSTTVATTFTTSAYYELTPSTAVNSVGLLNLSGVLTIRIRLTDPSFGVVYDKSVALNSVPTDATWYTWLFEERTQQTQFVATDLPTYPNAVLRIDLTGTTASVGVITFGSQKSIGMHVKQGARLGIQDYSRKERNDWGDTVLVQRAFASRLSIDVFMENKDLDNIYKTLTELRATPCLWLVSDAYASLVLYGFYNSFDINIQYANYSDCSIDLESLT